MKIISLLLVIILNILHKVHTQFYNNLNYNQAENFKNIRNPGTVYYKTYQYPIKQNQLTFTNNVLNQSRGTANYRIIKLTEDKNPYTRLNGEQNQRNTKVIEIRNPIAVPPQGTSLSRTYPENVFSTQHYSASQWPNSNYFNYNTPLVDLRFNTNDVSLGRSSRDYHAESEKNNNLNRKGSGGQPSAETFQYQYNKGWTVYEAVSVDDIVIPHLEERKYSKHSTPNAPDAHYYQKFFNIYNHVEHQTKQDLGQYEMESINDDFNGRSIVAPGQYPHMAAVGFLSNEEKIEFKCGGSLISKIFVITAAHCCYLNGETPIIVKLGIINLKFQMASSEPQRRTIKEIIVHPSYNSSMNYHDIALLKLQTPVEFTKFVRPVLLWSSNDIPYERVFTMGYGSTSFAKAPTNILTELSLSLIPLQQCREILPGDEKSPNGIVESQICGRDLEKNRDTCQGDSGGPLQLNLEHRKQRNTYRYYLVGIISYGEFCGSKKPGLYTRVSSYCKWIASVVWPSFKM